MVTHYVDSDETLAAAIEKAQDGDVIKLAAGIYKAIPKLLGKKIHIDGQNHAIFDEREEYASKTVISKSSETGPLSSSGGGHVEEEKP